MSHTSTSKSILDNILNNEYFSIVEHLLSQTECEITNTKNQQNDAYRTYLQRVNEKSTGLNEPYALMF